MGRFVKLAKLFILIKRKGSKSFKGVIPAKKGSTRKDLKRLVLKRLRSGFSARIVTLTQLKGVIKRMRPKRRVTKKIIKSKRKRVGRRRKI